MKRTGLVLALAVLFSLSGYAQPDVLDSMKARAFNLTSFTSDPQLNASDNELLSLVPAAFHAHPEFGKLPYSVGLDSVIELIDRRTEFTRTLVKRGTNGREIFIQKGYFPLHYIDSDGWWRTIDERLHPSTQSSYLYEAVNQPSPTYIDASGRFAAVENGGMQLAFNSGLLLFHEDASGNRTLIGAADWSNFTAGSEGVKVIDIWPGIDMEMIVSNGKIKTNYLVKTPLAYTDGWLVIEDHLQLPAGTDPYFTSSVFNADGLNFGGIDIQNASHASKFTISPAYGFDQSHDISLTQSFGYKLGANNQWDLYVPVSWTGNSALQFPLVIDPLVSSTATTLQAAITGSYQEPGGLFTNSCNYNMNVPTPANCTITNVLWSFNYIAQNGAALCYGAITFTVNGCNSPSGAGIYWFCNNCMFAGTCTGTNVSMFSDVSSCIPAPSCASYNLPATLKFYARGVPAGACSNFYVGANSNWVMTVQGQTVTQPAAPVSSNGTTICLGSNTTLTATGQYGVAPYTYLWNPGALTGQSITVAPTTTTTYTCTITDACGNTSVNTVTITVNTANTLTPAPAFSISLNPASGTPCPVVATVTYTGTNNYGGGSENYQWSFGGSSSITGGSTSGSANAPAYGGPYDVTYTTAGTYTLSVTIIKSGQCALASQSITICGVLPIELLLFEGAYDGQGNVVLNWATASEHNNHFFTIERTTDGVNFETIGTVNTLARDGNSISRLNYSFTDTHPFIGGTSYYRLKQTDFNGDSETFRMVSVTIAQEDFGFFAHPNPVQDNAELSFYSEGPKDAVIRVIDYTGRVVSEIHLTTTDGANTVPVNMKELAKGLYTVQLNLGESYFLTKMMKQ